MVRGRLDRVPGATQWRGITEIQVTQLLNEHAVEKGRRENVYTL